MKTFKHKNGHIATELNIPKLRRYSLTYKDYHYTIPAELIENSFDWVEQPEKDYEILAYKGFPSYEIHSTSFLAICSCKDVSFEIHSVKRLSDGEVFSVGEEDTNGRIIQGFKEDAVTLWVIYVGGMYPLSAIYKPKRQPILTIEDGVELFEGDKAYRIFINQPISKVSEVTISEKSYINLSYMKYFSTREAAEEYRLYNYRGLSLKDLDAKASNISEQSRVDLEELVKSRQ